MAADGPIELDGMLLTVRAVSISALVVQFGFLGAALNDKSMVGIVAGGGVRATAPETEERCHWCTGCSMADAESERADVAGLTAFRAERRCRYTQII